MYTPDTILKLKEPRSTEDKPFPYDRVRVINASPVSKGHEGKTKYTGADAQGVVIEPLESFQANLDEPFGKLIALYDVESVPERVVEQPPVRVIDSRSTVDAGPTPEQRFAAEAPGDPEASISGRKPRVSPLEDPNDAKADGPLGDTPEPETIEPVAEDDSPL